MREYKLELSDIEVQCGATLEQVQKVLTQVLVRNERVILPKYTAPALCGAVARCAFGAPAEFAGMNSLGLPVYRRA